MFSFLVIPSASEYVANRPLPAFYRRVEVMETPRLPLIGEIGTGGLSTSSYYQYKRGYRTVEVVHKDAGSVDAIRPPFSLLIEHIQAGFGRTMNRLPEVFGVSRQTLYNWLAGAKTPNEQHHAKLYELAAAAKVFQQAGFKPNSAALDRTVANGRSLLELIGDGRNGEDSAERLMRIVQRGSEARTKLADLLGDRKSRRLSASDMGTEDLGERS
ncbi:MAG: hypothetical protein WCG12_15445 [Alcaligenaceae bacterium]